MSFYSDIYTIMNADASINEIVDGIYAKRTLKEVNEGIETLIVFDYSKEESISSSDDSDYLSIYKIYVYVSSLDSQKVFDISEMIQEYLENYEDNNFLSFQFIGDNQSFDKEINIYYNDIEFIAMYSK